MRESERSRRSTRTRVALALAFLLGAFDAPARLIPTAPVNAWPVIPAVQKRSARHVVALELVSYGAACLDCVPRLMRVVIHDSQGIEGPRDVTPGGTPGNIMAAAAWEGTDGTIRLLLYGNVDAGGHTSPNANVLYSPDGGSTWAAVAVPAGSQLAEAGLSGKDFGGPVAASVSSPIRLGTPDVPFVLSIANPTTGGFWGVRADGSGFLLTPTWGGALLGSDAGGTRFLVAALLFASPLTPYQPTSWKIAVMDLAGNLQELFEIPPTAYPWMEGWITPDGSAYLNVDWSVLPGPAQHPQPLPSTHSLALWKGGTVQEIVTAQSGAHLFAVPSADFSHAWIVTTDAGATSLESHTLSGGFVESWRDPSGPPISALFAADSGGRLLLQTARSRQAPGNQELGLAVWSLGQSAPAGYDEIILNAPGPPTFVHLDVDAAAGGAPMLIDPGSPQNVAGPSGQQSSASPNLFQTQSLVRASLRQQLVIPAVARVTGRDGAIWRTDLILRNPATSQVQVTASLLANPATSSPTADASLVLAPGAIAVIPDVLGSLFHLGQASGALLLIPNVGGTLEATSRSYTASGSGTYGMSVDAEDIVAGAEPGFPQTFSAGLLGTGFRTNFVASDMSGQGSQLELFPQADGAAVGTPLLITVPPAGQTQLNDLAALTDTSGSRFEAFRVTCRVGTIIDGLIAIDNATDDPTWFGPDAPPGYLAIPAIVHASGANGAQYRTDLFVFNPDPIPHAIQLGATLWDHPDAEQRIIVTLAPGESRLIEDALFTLFGWSGVARLSIVSGFPNGGVLVTSRAYTAQMDGSTYGTLLPPLRAAQIATTGDTLEILGPTGAASVRTNLSLVEVGGLPAGSPPITVHIQILDDQGILLDAFDKLVVPGGGIQVNDLFHTRGLGDRYQAVVIRVSPSGGNVAAYATTIDNATNDPVYFAGNLAP